ncbi:MAG: cysteine-tryptophan domain-containing zinc finger protein [Kiritimatiellia bacterium]
MDALMALGELAAASGADMGMEDVPPENMGLSGRELQKWIQCCKCEKWRKVPYSIDEEQIPDSWTCQDNLWDSVYNSCEVDQELSDDKIDEILAVQGEQELAAAQQQQQELELQLLLQQQQQEQAAAEAKQAAEMGGGWGSTY